MANSFKRPSEWQQWLLIALGLAATLLDTALGCAINTMAPIRNKEVVGKLNKLPSARRPR